MTPDLHVIATEEAGSLQGVLVRVDGQSATLRDGDKICSCTVSHDLTRALGKYLFGPIVRLHGRGRWARDEDGVWKLIDFEGDGFDILDNASLDAAAKKLQAAGGFGFHDATDAWNTLREWRED